MTPLVLVFLATEPESGAIRLFYYAGLTLSKPIAHLFPTLLIRAVVQTAMLGLFADMEYIGKRIYFGLLAIPFLCVVGSSQLNVDITWLSFEALTFYDLFVERALLKSTEPVKFVSLLRGCGPLRGFLGSYFCPCRTATAR